MNALRSLVLRLCFYFICVASFLSAQTPTSGALSIFVQTGHSSQVLGLDKTSDDRFLVTGSTDATVKLWEIASAKEVRTFRGHTAPVTHVAISPDGKTIVSASSKDSSVMIWESVSGVRKLKIRLNYEMTAMLVRPAWNSILVSSSEDAVIEYSLQTGKEERRFQNVGSLLCISDDGKKAVSRLYDRPDGVIATTAERLHIWDLLSGQTIRKLDSSNAMTAAITRDTRYVVTGERNNTIKLWDITAGLSVRTFGYETEPAMFASDEMDEAISIFFSPDEKKILSAHKLSGYYVWDRKTGEPLRQLQADSYRKVDEMKAENGVVSIRACAFMKDGSTIFGIDGRRIHMWNNDTTEPILRYQGVVQGRINDVRTTPDGGSLILANSENGLRFFDVHSGKPAAAFLSTVSDIQSVAISNNGKFVLLVDQASVASLWDITAKQPLCTFKTEVPFAALSDDGEIAISANENEFAAYRTRDGVMLSTWRSPHITWSDITFIPNSRRVAIGFWKTPYAPFDGLLTVWDIPSGQLVFELHSEAGTPRCVSVSFDGKMILSGHEDNTLKLWDSHSGKLIRSFNTLIPLAFMKPYEGITAAGLSPDGRWTVSGSADGTIKIWRNDNGTEWRTLKGHTGTIGLVCFSPDSKSAFTAGADGSVRMWDIESGTEYVSFVSLGDADWVTMTREGYFDAGGAGARNINVSAGDQVYTIDNFFETYFRPDIVQAKLAGRAIETMGSSDGLLQGVKIPPTLKLLALGHNGQYVPLVSENEKTAHISNGVIRIKIIAEDAGGGVWGVRLFNNGKAVGENIRGFKTTSRDKKIEHEFSVTLSEGENKLSAIGMSDDKSESNPVIALLTYRKPILSKPDMHILAVGINQYRNAKYNLNYCVGDAQGFVNAITPKAKKIFSNIHTTLLLDREANRAGVLAALASIQAAVKPEDVLIIFYAGHGMAMDIEENGPSRNEFFYILSEVTQMSDPMKCAQEGISGTEMRKILSDIKATKQVMFVDACNSGAFAQQFAVRGAAEENALAKLSRASGSVIYASTTKEQFATELAALKHGAFTYVLIDALGGQAGLPNGQLTVSSIKAYVDDKIPEITKKYKGEEQYPTIFIWGQDFPIGMK